MLLHSPCSQSGFSVPFESLTDLFSLIFGINPIEALIYNFSTIKAPTYSSVVTGDYDYPAAGIVIAFFLVLSSITMIPIYTVKGYKYDSYYMS